MFAKSDLCGNTLFTRYMHVVPVLALSLKKTLSNLVYEAYVGHFYGIDE